MIIRGIPPWLLDDFTAIEGLVAQDRLPHALMISGRPGTGRRMLALSIALRALAADFDWAGHGPLIAPRLDEERLPAHPDLLIAQPEPDKRTIGIGVIRELIGFVNLTSHQRGAKVALITPGEALTHAAANSLLKTLEEPSGGSLLILVTRSFHGLPATVVSRCQRLRVPAPGPDEALAWLAAQEGSVDWPALLELAAGAPLTALGLHANGFDADLEALEADLDALRAGRLSPVELARRWSRRDPAQTLGWLYARAAAEIRAKAEQHCSRDTSGSDSMHLQNQGNLLNMDTEFGVLREIGELRTMAGSGINAELQLAGLLAHWYASPPLARN